MENAIDIDKIVDYRAEYSAIVQKPKVSGHTLTGLCPFHQDKNASFSVNLENGKYKCFSCGAEGNFLTFYANTRNIDTKEAYKEILEKYHISMPTPTYTVEEYAAEKRLPADWLKEKFGLANGFEKKDNLPYIRIPYMDEFGKAILFRKRYKKGTSAQRFKWSYGSAGKLMFYGEQNLKYIRDIEHKVVLVEGESDTQTLTFLGIPALGVPGATTFRPEWCAKLKGIDAVYIHVEPDNGGQTFLTQMLQKLHDGEYGGEVYRWSCKDHDVKDPSDLLIKYGKDDARDKVMSSMEAAERIDISRVEEAIPSAIQGAPVLLRQPEGWIYSEKGISIIDEKTAQPQVVCRTPIIITKRLRSMETGDEKIEVAFKRDGEWHSTIQPRSTIFQSRGIICLADLGCTITSENAKYVVRFLEKLEAENIDIIEKSDSASTFGWQSAKTFLPGLAPSVVLDIEPSLRGWASAYCQNGTFEAWKAMIAPHRNRDRFRFILAASFTAPLLRIVRQRIFFVYNWGGSKGGKSAALKAALSVWGDPERLMVNFNATQVALERMAGFYCDLPLGIDERQLAGNNQSALEKIVYMLASGTGKVRGSKTGGLQAMQTWRTVILATGEEPITTETSQTGVSTRVLEIYGPPFDDERAAGLMHQTACDNCGWAGIEFIKKIIELGDDEIRTRFASMLDYVYDQNNGKNGNHAAGIAAIATTDALVDEWFFGAARSDAEARARSMTQIMVKMNAENAVRDVNESATEFVDDWIVSNSRSFIGDTDSNVVRYGRFENENGQKVTYILPSILNKALTDAGFSVRKTLKYLAEQGIIETSTQDGTVRYSVVVRDNYKPKRMVKLYNSIIALPPEERASAKAAMLLPQPPKAVTTYYDDARASGNFVELDSDEDLPF